MTKTKAKLTLVLLIVAASLVACRHQVNTSNPKVIIAATLLDASNTCVTVEDGLTAANHAVESLETAEPEYYARVKPLLQKISAANKQAALTVQRVKNGGTDNWRGALVAVAASVSVQDLQAVQVKNPTSQLIVEGALATLVATLQSINTNFGGAK